jgi:hypothetical protein
MIKVKWPKVMDRRKLDAPILNWIDLGNGTLFRIAAFFTLDPAYGIQVSIERGGAFFLS